MRKKKQPEPEIVRLENCTAKAVPSYTITNLSFPDVQALADGKVPEWLRASCAWSVEDHPVGAVNPQYQTLDAEVKSEVA